MLTFPDPEMFQMQERKHCVIQLIIFRGFIRMFWVQPCYVTMVDFYHGGWDTVGKHIGFYSRNTRWHRVTIQHDKLQIVLFCVLVNKPGDLQQLPVCLCTSPVTIFYENKCWLSLGVLEVSRQLLQHKAAPVDRHLKSVLTDGSHLLRNIRHTNEMAQQTSCCTRSQR